MRKYYLTFNVNSEYNDNFTIIETSSYLAAWAAANKVYPDEVIGDIYTANIFLSYKMKDNMIEVPFGWMPEF